MKWWLAWVAAVPFLPAGAIAVLIYCLAIRKVA